MINLKCNCAEKCSEYNPDTSKCEKTMGYVGEVMCPIVIDLTSKDKESKYFKKDEVKKVKWDGVGILERIKNSGGLGLIE
jgi:hypothetical protein